MPLSVPGILTYPRSWKLAMKTEEAPPPWKLEFRPESLRKLASPPITETGSSCKAL
jgi:hypothetical protein